MKENTTLVNLNIRLSKDLRRASKSFLEALSSIDRLYDMQVSAEASGSLTRALERSAWAEIVSALSGCEESLPEGSKDLYKQSVMNLKEGIYDLYPVTVLSEDSPGAGAQLILGKVFLSADGGESYYSGVCGALNNDYNDLIKCYDQLMPVFAERLGALVGSDEIIAPESIPELKCIDVFSLSGGLNRPHKPICVFFSGGGKENVSSLSNMTVFINLYSSRFREITQKISERYLPWANYELKKLGDNEIARLLLIWLRGHDVGHFFGADNLGKEMSEFDMDYMILHELKSDYISLFNMRYLDSSVFGTLTKQQAYAAAISEMFRYIRRGGIYEHPDSGSAYLTYMALTQAGALKYEEGSGSYSFDPELFEKAVSDCTEELLRLFSNGTAKDARTYVKRWGDLHDVDPNGIPKCCPKELTAVFNDSDIPRLLEYGFEI